MEKLGKKFISGAGDRLPGILLISNDFEGIREGNSVKVGAGNSTFENKLPLNFPNASTRECPDLSARNEGKGG